MQARSGYSNLKGKDHLPSLKAINETNFLQATKFIKELYVVLISLFNIGQPLYSLLTTTTASLILHHPIVTKRLGHGNVISQYLIKAARKAKLVDTCYHNIPYEQLLYKWSKLIKDELENCTTNGMKASPTVASLTEGVLQQSMIHALHKTVKLLTANNKKGCTYCCLEENASKNKAKLSGLRTPEYNKKQHITYDNNDDNDDDDNDNKHEHEHKQEHEHEHVVGDNLIILMIQVLVMIVVQRICHQHYFKKTEGSTTTTTTTTTIVSI